MDFIKRYILVIALLMQALLLGWRLDLLPIWGDERYTLGTAAQMPRVILEALHVDVHPPLYYFLVKGWLSLPLPGDALGRARALSAIVALAATAAFYLLWLRRLPFSERALFLGLWVSSPFLTLYARIARSYTLQLLLTLIAIRMARDWLQSPVSRPRMIRYIVAEVILLYTHYLPGLAVAAGTACLGLWRRQWRHFAALAVMALAYAPWLGTLAATATLVAMTRPYHAVGDPLLEHLLKLGYAFLAFNFGETIPLWAAVVAAVLAPVLLWTLWNAWRQTKRPPVLFLLTALVGYFVAASWVSFPFVGARLLFLLPFYYLFLLRGIRWGSMSGKLIYAGLIATACGGLASYHLKQDFLNKGYLVDYAEIARLVREKSGAEQPFVLLDGYTASAGYYLHAPGFSSGVDFIDSPLASQRALEHVRHRRPKVIWYLRYARDLTPERLHDHLLAELARDYVIRRYGFVPYSWLDRKVIQALGFAEAPTHVVQAVELLPREGS